MIYLIHFDRPLHHARHYLGYCADGTLEVRLIRHRAGRGARLLAVLRELNIGWRVVRVFEGDRQVRAQAQRKFRPVVPGVQRSGRRNRDLALTADQAVKPPDVPAVRKDRRIERSIRDF